MGLEQRQQLLHDIHAEFDLVGYRDIAFVIEEGAFVAVVTECLLFNRDTERITKEVGGGSDRIDSRCDNLVFHDGSEPNLDFARPRGFSSSDSLVSLMDPALPLAEDAK
jgi:hypothetical protein